MRTSSGVNLRRGAVVPILAVCLIGLFAFIALAIDIGMMAVARTQCQDAADIGALAGCRLLDGKSANNNVSAATTQAQTTAEANYVLGTNITAGQVANVTPGVYRYDSTNQRFQGVFTSPATNEAYTLIQLQVNTSPQTYFGKVLGVSSVNVGAIATAVYRPRDLSIVLDFSGSMGYASQPNYSDPTSGTIQGLFPDQDFPRFGPWSIYNGNGMVLDYNNPGTAPGNLSTYVPPTPMQRIWPYVDSNTGYIFSPTNLTMATVNGPSAVGQFLLSDNATAAFVNSSSFPTFTNVNTLPNSNSTSVVTPAPSNFAIQNVSGFVGDPFPLRKGVTVAQGTAPTPDKYAQTVADVIGLARGSITNTTYNAQWETNGYDFDYTNNIAKSAANKFQGFTMGPSFFGKTFYMWPPDPRTPANNMGQAGYVAGDWRQRFFLARTGSGKDMRDNSVFWDSGGNWIQQSPGASAAYMVNYDAVLAWLKGGPQTLPASLRCGRLVYYDSIPTTVPMNNSTGVCNTAGLTNDQRFWKDYIDYVLGAGRWTNSNGLFGVGSSNSNTGGGSTLYYNNPSSSNLTPQITSRATLQTASTKNGNSPIPYMKYTDNPVHPRAHFWFGATSMLTYLNDPSGPGKWLPGNCYEAQCWQLKAGVNAALTDIQTNHPNDLASLIFFSGSDGYGTARVSMSKNFTTMQNALFFPFSLLSNLSDPAQTITPYGTQTPSTGNPAGLYDNTDTIVPNAGSTTDPQLGFQVAYNQFGIANDTSTTPATTYTGRVGASKVVIYETDGMPNTINNPSPGGANNGLSGSGGVGKYYYGSIGGSTYDQLVTALHVPCKDNARAVVRQICASSTASPPGFSTGSNPARVHALAFGDLYESYSTSFLKPGALRFLCAVQLDGGTSSLAPLTWTAGGTYDTDSLDYQTYYVNPEPYKVIVGSYATRISNIQQALQRIMQGGVQIALIQ